MFSMVFTFQEKKLQENQLKLQQKCLEETCNNQKEEIHHLKGMLFVSQKVPERRV